MFRILSLFKFARTALLSLIVFIAFVTVITIVTVSVPAYAGSDELQLSEEEYFATNGLNLLVFSNGYNGLFSDSKISGIEIIHHDVRTATNGDVRLNPTPEQWDPIPGFLERKVDTQKQSIEARFHYPEFDLAYTVKAQKKRGGIEISVILDKPLPAALEGKAGFNLEFLPAAYFEKSWLMDEDSGLFPLYPSGPMSLEDDGTTIPPVLARGRHLVLAPSDRRRRVSITSDDAELLLFDGRNKAQNGWFVVRSLLPANQSGTVLRWQLAASTLKNWQRPAVISYSQLGYHPAQTKIASIELGAQDPGQGQVDLLRFDAQGDATVVLSAKPRHWGRFTRYQYLQFDFSEVRQAGLYAIRYRGKTSAAFPIAEDVYARAWQPTLDIFFPVQMDHVLVNEAYRVWHGASHLDDALQAPINHQHFDLYAQGPTTDTAFAPGEHIPGLNIGGWYDAGDYDIRTQTQYNTVRQLVALWEEFHPLHDNTRVDEPQRRVDIHVPDHQPDVLQQIRHGSLALLAQFRAVGHAIPGIIVPTLEQYTHLGDGLTMTDNLIFDSRLSALESDGRRSGVFDDRWAFTSRSSALNYGSIAALAAAHRALSGFDEALAEECLDIAIKVWQQEVAGEPALFRHGNTTGGPLPLEKLRAAVELLVSTGDAQYADATADLLPYIEENFLFAAEAALRALPYIESNKQDKLDENFRQRIRQQVKNFRAQSYDLLKQNPFGVPVTTGGWAGSGAVIGFANNNFYMQRAFPDLVDNEALFRAAHYIHGHHPAHNLSLVSAVGAQSKRVAYGMNRADYSFIAGGIVPGILIIKPDFPENKEDWPFLWGENEYVINLGAAYLFMIHALEEQLKSAAP